MYSEKKTRRTTPCSKSQTPIAQLLFLSVCHVSGERGESFFIFYSVKLVQLLLISTMVKIQHLITLNVDYLHAQLSICNSLFFFVVGLFYIIALTVKRMRYARIFCEPRGKAEIGTFRGTKRAAQSTQSLSAKCIGSTARITGDEQNGHRAGVFFRSAARKWSRVTLPDGYTARSCNTLSSASRNPAGFPPRQ